MTREQLLLKILQEDKTGLYRLKDFEFFRDERLREIAGVKDISELKEGKNFVVLDNKDTDKTGGKDEKSKEQIEYEQGDYDDYA